MKTFIRFDQSFFVFPGPGHEFEDLDRVMKGMEHWAHRLYPKLPFDDVMKRISGLLTDTTCFSKGYEYLPIKLGEDWSYEK